jgi:subtilisin family serine protease
MFTQSQPRPRRQLLAFGLTIGLALTGALAVHLPTSASDVKPPAITEPFVEREVIVAFQPGTTAATKASARSAAGAVRGEALTPQATDVEVLTLAKGRSVPGALTVLQRNPNVRYAEPNYLLSTTATSNDPYFTNGSLWGMYGPNSTPANAFGSGAAEVWATGATGSRDIYVMVIDQGIQTTHPDLAANIWTNPFEIPGNGIDDDGNGYVDDIHGWDFFYSDNSVYDAGEDAHGTHVAGTIGGVGGNGTGVAGMNWQVTMISGKFLGPGGGSTAGAIRAVDYATDLKLRHGLNIVATSNSWGGGGYSQSLMDAITRGGDAGILFVAAAGNSSANTDSTTSYPQGYRCTSTASGQARGWDCVVSVASITSTGALSSFSNYGATSVDIGAPGSGVWSAVPVNSYASYNGTSMATPHVSGAIALCASMAPDLSAADLLTALMASATPTPSLDGRVVTGGRLNMVGMAAMCTGTFEPVSGTVGAVTATATTYRDVQISWNSGTVQNNTAWEIQRRSSASSWTTVARPAAQARSVTISGHEGDTTYEYQVRGVNSYGGGSVTAWSTSATATTPLAPAPYVCAAVSPSWSTPAGSSTRLSLGDDAQATVNLPFIFTYYDTPISQVAVSSNGFLRAGGGTATAFSNVSIPNNSEPNGLIAPFWDDLNPAAAGSVSWHVNGSSPQREFVVTWAGVPHFSDSTSQFTFQTVLEEATGRIRFEYQTVVTTNAAYSRGASATAGVESMDGAMGTQISSNQANLSNNTAYSCTNREPAAPVQITTDALAIGSPGVRYSETLAAAGGSGTYTWRVVSGSLPSKITLSSSSGVISGTTRSSGSWTFTVRVTDNAGASHDRTYTLMIAAPLSISTSSLADATVGTGYSAQLAATPSEAAPFTWEVTDGNLPPEFGLSADGLISGTPTAASTNTFTVQVTDAGGRTASRQFTISVSSAAALGKSSPSNGAKNLSRSNLTLTWTAAAGATGYRVEYRTGTTGTITSANVTGASTTSYRIPTTLAGRTTYTWQVTALFSGGDSQGADNGTWWSFSTAR